jgi:excisionase family DNA binding protein
MVTLEGMITVPEAARRLDRSIEQVRRYLREGKLRGQRIGNQWFVEESAIQDKMASPYEQQMEVLHRIRENRAAILRESGIQPPAAETVRQVREKRVRHLGRTVRRRERGP